MSSIFLIYIGISLFLSITLFNSIYVNKICNTNIIRQYVIYRNLRPKIDKLIRPKWRINKCAMHNITKKEKNRYNLIVSVISPKLCFYVIEEFMIDKKGNIIKEGLSDAMKGFEKLKIVDDE